MCNDAIAIFLPVDDYVLKNKAFEPTFCKIINFNQ